MFPRSRRLWRSNRLPSETADTSELPETNEYDKIQDYLPAITDDFQRERFHPICQDSLINAILADKDFCHAEKYQSYLRGSSSEKSNIPLRTEQYIFQPAG